ncbi:1290_t:CDS:2 [Diversispora eburnea]|uniref:1290_t:CDS:1 n=1 Tax=Diversispora eburnea TaxID=1213867 RepID=A0A9N9FFT1_9GLOM|nr:1290_t:CDS:2 [Diversispora eburnea]
MNLFLEFLQNADDVGARKFRIIIDERSFCNNDNFEPYPKMKKWQGPAIWIYNDSIFTDEDIHSLLKIRFCQRQTHIIFGSAWRMFRKRWKLNFLDDINKEFLSSDHVKSYLGIEGCNFKDEFKGTLFRPLRIEESRICSNILSTNGVLEFLEKLKQSAFTELLFLHNVESFEVMQLEKNSSPDDIKSLWEVKLTNVDDKIEMLIEELESFAKKNKTKARGGVAALYSASKEYKEKGRLYSFLPLPQITSLPVHLNGMWASSSVRENILLSNDNFAELDRSKLEWNRFILLEILPPLYAKLLKELVKFEKDKFGKERNIKPKKQVIDQFWPLPTSADSQLDYIAEF